MPCSHWRLSVSLSQPWRPLVVAAAAAVMEEVVAVTEAALAAAASTVVDLVAAASAAAGLAEAVSVQRRSEVEVSAQPLLGVADFAVELSPPMVFAALVFIRGSATTGGDLRSVHLHSE